MVGGYRFGWTGCSDPAWCAKLVQRAFGEASIVLRRCAKGKLDGDVAQIRRGRQLSRAARLQRPDPVPAHFDPPGICHRFLFEEDGNVRRKRALGKNQQRTDGLSMAGHLGKRKEATPAIALKQPAGSLVVCMKSDKVDRIAGRISMKRLKLRIAEH